MNVEHVERLKQGVSVWNCWRDDHPEIRPDLSEANLVGVELIEAHLSEADLDKAFLSEANLHNANLSQAELSDTNLSGAVRREVA